MSSDHHITRMAVPTAARASSSPEAASTPAVQRSALELSTGAETLGAMILRGQDREGVALRYKDHGSWREIS